MAKPKKVPLTFEEQKRQAAEAAKRRVEQKAKAEARAAQIKADRDAAEAVARAEVRRLRNVGAEARLVEESEKQEDGTTRKRFVVRARQIDVFQHLLERQALAQDSFDAVRAYEHDVSVALGHTTPERQPDWIKGSCEGRPGQNISQAQVEASRRMQWVRDRLPPRDFRLLEHLLINGSAHKGQWRKTVEVITGERMDHAQTAAVRLMADNVRDIRQAMPRREGETSRMNKGRWKNHATTVRYAEELLKGGAEGVVVIKRAALRELVQCAKRGLYADKAT